MLGNRVTTPSQDASLLSRCQLLCIAVILVGLLGPPAAFGQIAGAGLLGGGSGAGFATNPASFPPTGNPSKPATGIRSSPKSERGSGGADGTFLSRDEIDKGSAERAIDEARVALEKAEKIDPGLGRTKSFRELEESIREAEIAFEGKNFALARQEALLAKKAIIDLVPDAKFDQERRDEQLRSPIEIAFSQEKISPTISRDLQQFGYDIFGLPASTFAPVLDVPVGPDYTLGPDDTLHIRLWGLVDGAMEFTIDREGKIFLPNVGTIFVWGLSFKDAKTLIKKRLGKFYKKFQVDITIGGLRTIRVYVVGDVMRPGGYSMSSLSTVTNALYAAGGPNKSGSMRKIKLIRNEKTVGVVDLYDYLLHGSSRNDFSLQSGDTVFIPPIGPVVGVAGFIKRPAIYEFNGPVRVSDALTMAGGALPVAYLRRVQMERIKHHREKVFLDIDLTGLESADMDSTQDVLLQDGDLIKVSPIYSRMYESVTLEGFVKHPGQYELKPGMRLSDIVTVDEIVPETNLDRGELLRVDRETLRYEVIAFVPRLLLQADRSQDTRLKPEDKITLYSEYKDPDIVSLGGEFKRPGVYTLEPGEMLSSVIRRAGGFTAEAYPKAGVFLRESIKKRQEAQMIRMVSIQTQRLAVEQAALAAGAVATGIAADSSAGGIEQSVMGQKTLLAEAQEQVMLGRLVVDLTTLDFLEGTGDDILLQGGDSLHVPQAPVSVAVLGSVRNPTALLHRAEKRASYYIQGSGGLTQDADSNEMYILRVNGDTVSEGMHRYSLEAGDAIIIPPKVEARIQPLPFWSSILTIVGNAAIGLSAMFLIF